VITSALRNVFSNYLNFID